MNVCFFSRHLQTSNRATVAAWIILQSQQLFWLFGGSSKAHSSKSFPPQDWRLFCKTCQSKEGERKKKWGWKWTSTIHRQTITHAHSLSFSFSASTFTLSPHSSTTFNDATHADERSSWRYRERLHVGSYARWHWQLLRRLKKEEKR